MSMPATSLDRGRLSFALLPILALGAVHPTAEASASREGRSPELPTPTERALTGGLAVLKAPATGMIRVTRSSFVMGSTPDEVLAAILSCGRQPLAYRCNERSFSNELPARRVELPAFLLDRTEVTRRDYERCVARGL
jgi:formylglycine-generating enzyme required for sulfatase activity